MSQAEHFLSTEQLLEVYNVTKTATAIHVGEDAVIQAANDAMLQIWGKDRSVIGKSLEDALPELKGQPFLDMFKRVWNEGLTFSGKDTPADIEIDGQIKTFYFEFEYRAIKNTEGQTICILHTAIDVTDRVLDRVALQQAKEKAEMLEKEQALNEELASANEELSAVNEELTQSQDSLSQINNELEARVAARVQALSESEARFRVMAEGTDIFISVGDESSKATYFNRAWVDLTGRPMKELLEFGWVDLIHPDDRDAYVNIYLTAFKKQQPFEGEFRLLTKKGDYRWLLAKGPPRFRPDGSFAGYISSAVDITERKQFEQDLHAINEEMMASNEELASANEELAAVNEEMSATNEELLQAQDSLQSLVVELATSEERFRNLVLLAPIGICMIKGDPFHVEVVNDTFLELIRKERSDFDNQSYWEVIPEAAEFYEPITRKVIATGQPYYANGHEIKLLRKGIEETVYVDFVYEPIRNLDGSMDTILIIANDVTEQVLGRKKAEQAEESLRMAVTAAGLGTYYINAEDRIFVASPRLKEFFGYGPDEDVPYEAAINQIHADYRETAAKLVETAFTTGERFDMEYPVIGFHDGKTRWVRGIGTMQQRDGKSYFTGVLHEITEQKQDEIRKNDFIGMVSHELKTPLTTLTALVQVANSKVKSSDDSFLVSAMDRANTQVKKMSKMINGFLNISRLESGKLMIVKQSFDLTELLKEIIEENAISSTDNIIFDHLEKVTVNADRDKIGSVISNLISNAIKYSSKEKAIEVKQDVENKKVTVSIKDYGIGIKPQDAEKLFERYYRVESNSTQHISGFGIGLYLSAEIIKRHEGSIWVESEFGVGSTFYFTLPL